LVVPKVSVVVPNYNHARYLPKRIESILAQDFQDYELIILDDCSPDESRRVIRSYEADPRVRTVFNETNSGSTFKQWNRGLGATKGEYVWFAESDDCAEPTFLSKLVSQLDRNPNVGLAVSRSLIIDENDNKVRTADQWVQWTTEQTGYDMKCWASDFVMSGREFCSRFMYPWNTLPNGSAILFRRASLDAAGGIETDMRVCGDWMTYVNVLMVADIAYVAEPLNHFRTHSNNVRSKSGVELYFRESQRVTQTLVDRLRITRLKHLSDNYLQMFVQAFLFEERRPPRLKIPLSRQLFVVGQSGRLSSEAQKLALRILMKENMVELAYRLGILSLVRRIAGRPQPNP
jgi:glycosyltransferase involved in cell wall biosynthesis